MNAKRMTQWLLIGLAAAFGTNNPFAAANTAPPDRSQGVTFGEDLAFLQKHTEIIVLSDEKGQAQVALSRAWQGRVITSTAQGKGGRSFGWINHEHIASEKIVPHMNIFGGEERFWMGPEGGRFSIFHKVRIDWENWQVPPPLDSLPFKTVSHSKDRASFEAEFSLENYSGTRFQVAVKREIRLLDSQTAWSHLGLPPSKGVSLVAYESHNTLRNTGRESWRKETGLLSIWIAGMHPSSPSSVFVAPIKPGPVSELGVEVTSDYFGAVGPDRLKVTKNAVLFRIDAAYQSKLGIGPRRSVGKFGTYDPQHHTLTIAQFTQPEGVTDYVKSLWKITDDPFVGDAINVYNDGPTKPGAKAFGPFQELESSSPAAALEPGGSIEHTHRTIHLTGSESGLDAVARAVLGISLAEITKAFAGAPKIHTQRAVLVTGASSGCSLAALVKEPQSLGSYSRRRGHPRSGFQYQVRIQDRGLQ